MELVAQDLASYLIQEISKYPQDSRLLVGLAGIPASGKTSLAHLIISQIECRQSNLAIVVGLDGWHLTRDELSLMQDPKLAFERRGAYWTFDPASYLSFVRQLKEPISKSTGTISAPSFDHALKDPTPSSVHILPSHRIVIIEGLYVLLALDQWEEAARMVDERWIVDLDVGEAKRRLVRRHVLTGVTSNEEEATLRAEGNDGPNGIFIMENLVEPTRRIRSIDETSLA